MGLQFRRRLRIVPGLWLNLSKSGVSTSNRRPRCDAQSLGQGHAHDGWACRVAGCPIAPSSGRGETVPSGATFSVGPGRDPATSRRRRRPCVGSYRAHTRARGALRRGDRALSCAAGRPRRGGVEIFTQFCCRDRQPRLGRWSRMPKTITASAAPSPTQNTAFPQWVDLRSSVTFSS